METTKIGTGTVDTSARRELIAHPKPIVSGTGTKKALGGFTLVELIVVITILVILGTIAFINLGNFAGSARDSARISNLTNLQKGLSLFQIKSGSYPMPEGYITINASGATILGYQGFAKEQIEGIAKLSVGATKDPLDATMYTTYSVNGDRTKMQVMAFLEDGNTVTTYIPIAFASTSSDYSKRTPLVRGDILGILLASGSLQPVQEKYNVGSFTGVDVVASTGGLYKAYITSTNTISGTGTIFIPLLSNYDSTIGTYPGCDTKDIKLPNGQIWAACNVGATSAYNGINQPLTLVNTGVTGGPTTAQKSYMGGYYQWGRNDDVTTGGTGAIAATGTLANTVGHSNFIPRPSPPYDWLSSQNDNLWGGQGTGTGVGTFVTQGFPSLMQGPCQNEYHVPTHLEWCNAVMSIDVTIASCIDTLWVGTSLSANILKISFSGYRRYNTAIFEGQGGNGYYWSSSVTSSRNVCVMTFASSLGQVRPGFCGSRPSGYSIRCLKN